MYTDYWKLAHKPFEATTEGGFYYPSESHQAALLKLRYAVESGRGAALITGPSGIGKTLLVEQLLSELPEEIFPVVQVVYPQMVSRELLAYVATRLTPGDMGNFANPTADQSWLRIEVALQEAEERGRRPLVVIDEAHLLEDAGLLETIRLMMNLRTAGQPQWTLLLVGQSSMVSTLSRMPRFEERVDIASQLEPLTDEQTFAYIRHRLTAAGSRRDLFSPGAIEAIQYYSHGIPRRINRLGDLALLVGFAQGESEVHSELVQSVASDLAFSRAA